MSVAILGSLLRTAVPGIGRWCVAHALLAAASSWVLIAGGRPNRFAVIGASFITLTAVLLLVQGTRQFFGNRPSRHDESAAFVIILATLAYFTFASPNLDARVGLISAFLAAMGTRWAIESSVASHRLRPLSCAPATLWGAWAERSSQSSSSMLQRPMRWR